MAMQTIPLKSQVKIDFISIYVGVVKILENHIFIIKYHISFKQLITTYMQPIAPNLAVLDQSIFFIGTFSKQH